MQNNVMPEFDSLTEMQKQANDTQRKLEAEK
jgi:hypothetical protein